MMVRMKVMKVRLYLSDTSKMKQNGEKKCNLETLIIYVIFNLIFFKLRFRKKKKNKIG